MKARVSLKYFVNDSRAQTKINSFRGTIDEHSERMRRIKKDIFFCAELQKKGGGGKGVYFDKILHQDYLILMREQPRNTHSC